MADRDPIAASRFPNLPDAGYHTRTQRELSDAIMFLIRGLERDRLLLLEVVIAGPARWRKTFVSAYRAIKADDEMADAVFGYLQLLAGPNPEASKAMAEQAIKHRQQRTWDKRLRTALAQSKDTKALMEAIRKDEAKTGRKPVTIFLGGKAIH